MSRGLTLFNTGYEVDPFRLRGHVGDSARIDPVNAEIGPNLKG